MRPSLEQRIESTNKQDIDLAPLLDVVFILLIFKINLKLINIIYEIYIYTITSIIL